MTVEEVEKSFVQKKENKQTNRVSEYQKSKEHVSVLVCSNEFKLCIWNTKKCKIKEFCDVPIYYHTNYPYLQQYH